MKAPAIVVFVAAILASTVPSSATTFNAATDYTGSQNAAGVWTYGEISSGVFSLLTPSGGAFLGGDAFNTPLIDLSSSTQLRMHPGEFGELVDLRFTAPATGTYAATFSGFLGDSSCGSCADTDGVTMLLGNTSVLLVHPDYSTKTLNATFALTAGQTIDFEISPNSNFINDTTIVTASVSTVPEPMTLSLFGAGLAGAAAMRRRKKSVA